MSTSEQFFVLDEPIVPGIYSRCERHLNQAQGAGCVALHMFIDSAWGDYREALRIHTLIVSLTMPVVAYCSKRAMGAGLLVFIAATKREASPEARFMIESTAQNAPAHAGTSTPFPGNDRVRHLLLERGISLSPQELDQFDRGTNLHFSSLEALSCGIVHDLARHMPEHETAKTV